jgi:hypothetical protein
MREAVDSLEEQRSEIGMLEQDVKKYREIFCQAVMELVAERACRTLRAQVEKLSG